MLEARAQYGITRANLFPTLDAQGFVHASRSSSIGSFPFITPGTNLAASYTQAGLQFNWELDLWGRLRRLDEAARAQYLASEEARNGVIISLISDVMTTYFALREQDLELEIGRQNNGIARDNLRLIRLRKDRGAANGLEVQQAEQFLYTTTAQIPSVQRSIAQSPRRLESAARQTRRRKSRAARLWNRSPLRPACPRGSRRHCSNAAPIFGRLRRI